MSVLFDGSDYLDHPFFDNINFPDYMGPFFTHFFLPNILGFTGLIGIILNIEISFLEEHNFLLVSLKVFLTALAIIDDLGAIVIIALFYSGDLSIKYLSLMLIAFIILLILNKFNVKKFLPYLIVGLFLWEFTHQSGIHATIAGVLLACTIPHRKKEKDFSLLIKLEHAISPYVAFGIMPLFAFANAGVSLEGLSFASLLDKVPLGILLGLFVGKQLGVFVFSYVSIKMKIAQMPNNSNWFNFYGVGVLTGIGFTMSLFVGNLAFVENMQYMDGVKIGVLTGSLLSTLFGYFLILLTPNK